MEGCFSCQVYFIAEECQLEAERERENGSGCSLLFHHSVAAEDDYGYTIRLAYFHDGSRCGGG